MRLLRFSRHFALNCLNCLTFLTRTLNLIISSLFPTFVLFPISACSFFDNLTVSTQHVPFSNSITHPFIQSFNRSFVHSLIAHLFHPLIPVGHNYYLFLYYSFIFSSGIFFLPEQIRIQSFSVSLCRYDVLSLLNGTK